MSWTPDAPSTEEVLATVLSSTLPALPPQESRLGASTVSWWETDPGVVYIHAQGGTPDDRHYASTLTFAQLEGHGFRRAQFDLDDDAGQWLNSTGPYSDAREKGIICPQCKKDFIHSLARDGKSDLGCGSCGYRVGLDDLQGTLNPPNPSYDPRPAWLPSDTAPRFGAAPELGPLASRIVAPVPSPGTRTASWVDIMAKAKRLIQSGQVQVLRNGFNYIVGHVIGDHGDYDTEISRDDPNSRAITGWECSCPWDQYAWQRSRQFKKFEGRPCFLPGSLVTTADGQYQVIDDIEADLRVLTHNGHGAVMNRWDNQYSGRVLEIKRAGSSFPMSLTEDHKVYANLAGRDHLRTGAGWYREAQAVKDPVQWRLVEAKDLRPGDWLRVAYPTEQKSFEIDLLTRFPVLRERDGRVFNANSWLNSLPRIVTSSTALARVVGYFVSEGNVENYYEGVPKEVSWTFHREESAMHEELRQALLELGAGEPRVYVSGQRMTLRLSNTPLALLLAELCGTSATSKQLVAQLMVAPHDFQRAMLAAHALGDGHIVGEGFVLTTASDVLARQLGLLGARLYKVIPTVQTEVNRGGPTQRAKRFPIYKVKFATRHMHGRLRLGEGYFAARVTGMTESHYEGPVYDLNVDPQHTYAVEDNCVSNCAHVMALYWKALSTPLDEQLTPEQAEAMGTGQAVPAPAVPEHPPEIEQNIEQGKRPDTHEFGLPRSFGPEGEIIQGDQQQMNLPPEALGGPPGPAQAPLAPPPQGPQPPGILPPFPGEQQEMQWAGPGTTPGGMESPPGAYTVPGAKPMTPANPIQNPSTYSKTAAIPLDQIAYIAEGAMERAGMTGRQWHVPQAEVKQYREQESYANERLHPVEAEMTAFARQVTGDDHIKVQASGYFSGGDTVRAETDLWNRITVEFDTNDLTLLHECAHVIRADHGHDAQWMTIAHDLYGKYLGQGAAETFWNLVQSYVEGETPEAPGTISRVAGQAGFAQAISELARLKASGTIRDFVLIGSVASALYAAPGQTEDLDAVVLVDSDEEYLDTLGQVAGGQFDGMHITLGGVPVQLFPVTMGPLYEAALQDARSFDLGGQEVKVASPEILTLLARQAGRPKDQAREALLQPHIDPEVLSQLEQQHGLSSTLSQDEPPSQSTSSVGLQIYESKRYLHAAQASQPIEAKLASLDRMAGFNAPEPVRAKKPLMGLAEGPVKGQHGDGEYREIPAGTPGEVYGVDSVAGQEWIQCRFDLPNSGANEPFRVNVFVEPGDIESAADLRPSDPAIRRHVHAIMSSVPVLGASIYADEAQVAFIRHKYASQLQQQGHALWFKPGDEPGRGMIHDPTGRVHTWPESEATHASMIDVNGYRGQDCCRFYIQPNGVVNQVMGPSSSFMTIMRADPTLARANGIDPRS